MEYSEGKWEVCQTPLGGYGLMIDGKLVADVNTGKPLADAHLISAAPDLYEACKDLVNAICGVGDQVRMARALRVTGEALAKAEGK